MLIAEYCKTREGKTWESIDTEFVVNRLKQLEKLAQACALTTREPIDKVTKRVAAERVAL